MNEYEMRNILGKLSNFDSFLKEYEIEKEKIRRFVEVKSEEYRKRENDVESKLSEVNSLLGDIDKLRKQYSTGFPLLAEAIANYQAVHDKTIQDYLLHKANPATTAAENIKIANHQKREAIKAAKQQEYLIKYYENLFPFLLEVKGQIIDELDVEEILGDYSEEEKSDRVTWFVSKEEFRKLSSTQRNQLALDRYWDRRQTDKGIGNLYERFVGWGYEKKGFEVEYTGINSGFEDLGRDLVCSKGNEIVVIQCKYWSEFKTIFENHIFQFFGTVYRFKQDHPNKKVKAAFYTKTKLSDMARGFAEDFNIELHENFRLERYPCIKCNVSSKTGEKIYHLPFDQQYDSSKIEPKKGELYVMSAVEAENAGFRRAFKWNGE